jgi:hypothetical protein
MNSKDKYEALTARVRAAHGWDFTDVCIDAENCGVKDDNSEEFWAAMLVTIHNSAGDRLSEAGIDPATVGIRY